MHFRFFYNSKVIKKAGSEPAELSSWGQGGR